MGSSMISEAKETGELIESKYHYYIYNHTIDGKRINCPHLLNLKSKDALKCPIYHSMKEKYEFTQKNLDHLERYQHFENEYQEKPKCRYGQECKSYIRCEQNTDENSVNDECHMKIFRHPPRTRQIQFAKNMHSMISIKYDRQCHAPSGASYTSEDTKKLIDEVIKNGYKYDLCTKCDKSDECKHNVYTATKYSILKVVNEKMDCRRHKLMGSPLNRAQMLALVLYTGLIAYLLSLFCVLCDD